jgi:hypothetical protein
VGPAFWVEVPVMMEEVLFGKIRRLLTLIFLEVDKVGKREALQVLEALLLLKAHPQLHLR